MSYIEQLQDDYEQRQQEEAEQEEYEFCVGILKAIRYDLDAEQFAYVAFKLGIDKQVIYDN